MKCPFCGKDFVEYGDMIDSEFTEEYYYADFNMHCEVCGKEWVRKETYKLVEVKNEEK